MVKATFGTGADAATAEALVDTGADRSLLSADLALRIPGIALKETDTVLFAADQEPMAVIGMAYVDIAVGSRRLNHRFYVTKDLRPVCILGIDILAKLRVSVKVHKRTVTFEDDEVADNVVKAASETRISAHTSKLCRVRLPGKSGQFLIDSIDDHVPDSLVKFTDGRARVRIFNPTDEVRVIYRGTPLGTCLDIEEQSEDERGVHVREVRVGERKIGLRKMKTPAGVDSRMAKLEMQLNELKFDGVPKELVPKYKSLLRKFSDVLSVDSNEVGHCTELPQRILLQDEKKIACTPPYRIPEHLKEVAIEYVEKLRDAGIIQKSTSPFNSPLLLVKKASATPDKPLVEQYRVVHDYRRLNENIVKDSYPMRNIYELLDAVAQAKVWSVIDLSSGFWNQDLDPDSRAYTAFGLPGLGQWEYTRSAQGLCNSPAAFQRLLDYVTRELEGVYVYIDDVIVCAASHEEQMARLSQVFERFRKFNLMCRLSKLQLGAAEVNYLGYNVSRKHGIRAGELKTRAIAEWPVPKTLKEVKQFMGLCSFFRRTIDGFATIARPLSRLTQDKVEWTEGELPEEAVGAFKALKEKLMSRPCLAPTDFSKPFILTVDASTVGMGAILSQVDDDGLERPRAYGSRVLLDVETRWAPTQLEFGALRWAMRYFEPYLRGAPFKVRTDHKPLTALTKIQGQALERMRAELEEFLPFTVEYMKGTIMPADGLSRVGGQKIEISGVEYLKLAAPQIGAVRSAAWGTGVADMPGVILPEQAKTLQREDKLSKALACVLKFQKWPSDESLLKLVKSVIDRAEIRKGIMGLMTKDGWRTLAPRAIQTRLLQHCHDAMLAGHKGVKATLDRLLESWVWPNVEEDVTAYVGGCKTCLSVNPRKSNHPAPLGNLGEAVGVGSRVHLDLAGPWPLDGGNRYVLVIIDAYSKWVELCPLPDKSAESAALGFYNAWICRYGQIEKLVSDQGKEFCNKVMKEICSLLQISHQTTSAYHPQANGQAERMVREVLRYVRKHLEGRNDWARLLAPLMSAHNTATHSSLGRTPFIMMFGRRPRFTTSLIEGKEFRRYAEDEMRGQIGLHSRFLADAAENQRQVWEKQRRAFDQRARERKIEIGDYVYVQAAKKGSQFQKFQPEFEGPWIIVEKLGPVNCKISNEQGKTRVVHVNLLKWAPFVEQRFQKFEKVETDGEPRDYEDNPLDEEDRRDEVEEEEEEPAGAEGESEPPAAPAAAGESGGGQPVPLDPESPLSPTDDGTSVSSQVPTPSSASDPGAPAAASTPFKPVGKIPLRPVPPPPVPPRRSGRMRKQVVKFQYPARK